MSASRVLADTSALLALANGRDQYHRRATDIARRFLAGGGRLMSTALVLAELYNHVLYLMGPSAARRTALALLQDPAYEWQDASLPLLRAAVAGWLERFADQRFSLTDAVSFEVMRRQRLTTAFAFDEDFVTAGFDLLR
ncbi:MAG: PIN domain-containing protein [Bryobacteraceae bacterium]|jgi:predicted nucleic acid-binding protein